MARYTIIYQPVLLADATTGLRVADTEFSGGEKAMQLLDEQLGFRRQPDKLESAAEALAMPEYRR